MKPPVKLRDMESEQPESMLEIALGCAVLAIVLAAAAVVTLTCALLELGWRVFCWPGRVWR